MKYGTPSFKEDHISQIPALQLLHKLGYTYLPPEEALRLRGGRMGNVILEGVLAEQLRSINRVRFKGNEYAFTEGNIISAIQTLKDVIFDGLVRTNEKIYDLLCLGRSLQQSIDGNLKSFPLNYIDWKNWKNNAFHMTAEYSVERPGSHETLRPDIVLFVNGIPLCVIECKAPTVKEPIPEAVSQHLRNQGTDAIPKLYIFGQLLLALSSNDAKYATVGTAAKFWSAWKEREDTDEELRMILRRPVSEEEKDALFSERFAYARDYFDKIEAEGRQVTEQDRAILSLCRPERLLELMYRYTVFDGGERKIARYQQFFCVRRILDRVRKVQPDGSRLGGVVWHTQGSGKSLTMVMLAEGIALEKGFDNFKIILVTDRVDLDDQIYKTFQHCGAEPVQATTGRDLARLIGENKERIITTVIDKFDAAVAKAGVKDRSPNIFVLVDEAHRSQSGKGPQGYGEMHAKMRRALPNACFIGFTGTPLVKKDKQTVGTFGGLIDTYTISQAVTDKAVVPLLYEGRHVDQKVDRQSVDAWFERVTEGLSKEQKADLKRKFTTTDQLNKAQGKVMRIAWDVSVHYRDTWKGTPYKAQLVAQDKSTALLYKKFLDEFGIVTSEVMISPPDDRKGNEEVDGDNPEAVQAFWKKMMARFGSEKEYKRQIIGLFKNAEQPEIIIVVEMLLTGFDVPRNTVLYLTKKMEGHSLLQAIARVNRLYEGKDFGYIIDYRGILQKLGEALDVYANLSEFDKEGLDDLAKTLTDVNEQVRKLPQRRSDLWDVFKTIKNKRDAEEYEQLLADEPLRDLFKERLSAYAMNLAVALSSVSFLEATPEAKIAKYKNDLKFFMKLRASVSKRYAETINFKEYEGRIQKLIDTHVGTGEVEKVTDLVNIFDADAFNKELERAGGAASKADTIAHRVKRTIKERMEEDPVFYRKFSELLERAIAEFRQQRLSDAEYLRRVAEIAERVKNRTGDEIPAKLEHNDIAKAFYGILLEVFSKYAQGNGFDPKDAGADAGLKIDEIIRDRKVVYWTHNRDVQNQMKGAIEDYLFELKEKKGFDLTFEDIDQILEACLEIARLRHKA